MAKQWYAVHTYSGQEDKVQQNIEKRSEAVGLKTRISRVVVPTEKEMRMRGQKMVEVKKKIFPGYVLIEMDMDDETWHFIRQTVGVTGFLGQVTGTATRPTPLRPEEVDALLGETLGLPKVTTIFHTGDQVSITGGPFTGSEGRIEEINTETEKLTVSITLFGREQRVPLDFTSVEKVV
jgi:transcriptional antiterminator NusG